MSLHDVFLIDVDSVLVRPLGYRESLRATMNHFGLRMSQLEGAISPTYAEIDAFEAHGFTSEWHSIPLCLAACLEAAGVWRETFDATVAHIAREGVRLPRLDYTALVREIARPGSGKLPAHQALEAFLARTPPEAAPVLHELLEDITSIDAPATRVFQHYVIGSDAFRETYSEAPDFEGDSYLATRDESMMTDKARRQLIDSDVPYAIYTARPSHPPPGVPVLGYSPEAEMALRLVSLEGVPLVGLGHTVWLAAQVGAHPDALVKPSPVQAYIAIGAAWTGDIQAGLDAARALFEHGEPGDALASMRGERVRVTVFEDTPTGMQAVIDAGERLRAAGLDVQVRGVGIAPDDEAPARRERLAAVADVVVPDFGTGLDWALV